MWISELKCSWSVIATMIYVCCCTQVHAPGYVVDTTPTQEPVRDAAPLIDFREENLLDIPAGVDDDDEEEKEPGELVDVLIPDAVTEGEL